MIMKSKLYLHAKRELELLGMYANTPENEDGLQPKLADSILEMIEAWGKVGHSGGSAEWTREVVYKLLGYEALTPITSDSDEWEDISEMNGSPMWQNKRDSRNFSKDGGRTWWNIDDKKETTEWKNSHDYKQALYAADKALDEPNVDPDDDLRTISRQFIRMTERYEHLEKQIDKLATFIMENIPGEPSESEGAVDTAIRLLSKPKEES